MDLNRFNHSRILNTRICDMGLTIRGSDLAARVRTLHQELANKQLKYLRPNIYLGDEWFSPEGAASISVPFWLAHPKLAGIEAKFMRRVEGGTADWCMRLLRHEAGHCFDHMYKVSRTQNWREIFGDPRAPYEPDNYQWQRGNKDFVVNLEEGYGQSHPDEDFAETFAAVLRPNSRWRLKYSASLTAQRKITYVEELIERFGQRRPRSVEKSEMCAARKMRITLGRYYQARQNLPTPCLKAATARK